MSCPGGGGESSRLKSAALPLNHSVPLAVGWGRQCRAGFEGELGQVLRTLGHGRTDAAVLLAHHLTSTLLLVLWARPAGAGGEAVLPVLGIVEGQLGLLI